MPFVLQCVIAKLPIFFLILILLTKTTFILLQFIKLIKCIVENLKKATVSFPSASIAFLYSLCKMSGVEEGIFCQN
jgi:hypothetical protein